MTSRLTVEAARFIPLAISRIDESEAIPREISSRSARVRARGDRQRAAGQIPPRGNNIDRMQLCSLPKARPISCCDCPAFQRFQTSRFSIAESPNRFPGLMSTPPPEKRFTSVVLHRPIECTTVIGQVDAAKRSRFADEGPEQFIVRLSRTARSQLCGNSYRSI